MGINGRRGSSSTLTWVVRIWIWEAGTICGRVRRTGEGDRRVVESSRTQGERNMADGREEESKMTQHKQPIFDP